MANNYGVLQVFVVKCLSSYEKVNKNYK